MKKHIALLCDKLSKGARLVDGLPANMSGKQSFTNIFGQAYVIYKNFGVFNKNNLFKGFTQLLLLHQDNVWRDRFFALFHYAIWPVQKYCKAVIQNIKKYV